MQKKGTFILKAKSLFEEIILYWNNPRPGEYVSYKEIVMLSVGWLAQYFVVQFSIGFSVGNGAVSMLTGLFLPWVYGKCGFDGSDYSVLDVYVDYNPDLPLSQQKKNPYCVLYWSITKLLTSEMFTSICLTIYIILC